MNARDRLATVGVHAAAIASLLLALPHLATAQGSAPRANGKGKAHVRPGYTLTYPLYPYPGACLLYGACAGLWWDDRRPWRRPIAPDQTPTAEQDIWSTTGSPWGYIPRLPPPTPESHIQPRYRDASTIRPEFTERDGAVQR